MVTEPAFKFIAGALCLDFINTAGGWVDSHPIHDKLSGFPGLVRWSVEAGVLHRQEAKDVLAEPARDIFSRAIALRRAFYRVCEACLASGQPPSSALRSVNRELEFSAAHARLRYAAGRFDWAWDQPVCAERILWSISRSAGQLLVSPQLAQLRQCPGEDCGWMFIDTSRNGSRQWCEMRICGNRAKIRRFRQRLRRDVK